MQDVIVEMIVDEVAIPLPATYDDSALEIYVTPPDTHYKIGGADPVADPNILVWYQIPGEG